MTEEQKEELGKIFEERKKHQKEIAEKISKERLLELCYKMHLWIFKNCIGEDEVYDELGLTNEENFLFGYGGSFEIKGDPNE